MSEELPCGWTSTTLGEIRVDKSSTVNPAKAPNETFELYSIPAFATGVPEIVKGSEIGSTKQSLVPGTVVVSKINPRINRVWVVGQHSKHRQLGSSEWIPFFPTEGVEPEYLAYYLRQDSFRNYLASNVSGVGGSLMRVRPSVLDTYPIVLAPPDEQRRIVAAIESFFTRLDDASATLVRVQQRLKRYRASVLKAAVEGRLVPTEAALARAARREYEPASVLLDRILVDRRRRWEEAELARKRASGKPPKDDKWKAKYKEPVRPDTERLPELPEGWCWATVDQLAEVGTGATPLRSKVQYWSSGKIAWVTSAAVNEPVVRDASALVTQAALDETNLTVFPPGTILVAMYGEGSTRGRATVLGIAATTNQALAALTLRDASEGCRDWLLRFFEFNYEEFRRAATGGVQPNMNLGIIRTTHVPLPPVTEQGRILAEMDRMLTDGGAVAKSGTSQAVNLAQLRQCILKWAFEGRLVETCQ